jgi:hypothetical protein
MPIHTRPRLAGIGDDLSITRRGTDGFHDSPLEETVTSEPVSADYSLMHGKIQAFFAG